MASVEPRPERLTAAHPRGASVRFAAAAVILAACVPAVAALLVGAHPAALGLALLTYLAAAALAVTATACSLPLARVGPCNLVTLIRLLLTSALIAPLVAPGTTAAIVTVAVLALVLDGLDGWLARRHGDESAFGARFDMEVDAAFGLVLALNAWRTGTVGPEVLLLGLPRYLFAVAGRVWPWLTLPLPERLGRKTVCVVQILALIALQLPLLAGPIATALVLVTLGALGWSFGRDVLWLREAGR
jgi:phosphatidylglycerophosphate synthase